MKKLTLVLSLFAFAMVSQMGFALVPKTKLEPYKHPRAEQVKEKVDKVKEKKEKVEDKKMDQ